jgi:hypothetical protein
MPLEDGGYPPAMTTQEHGQDHDQDADPPTPFGDAPDTRQLDPGSEPASDPDPAPGSSNDLRTPDTRSGEGDDMAHP